MQLVFATHNKNKAKEIQSIVPVGIQIVTLDDLNCTEDIPETENTLEGNARLKSQFVVDKYELNCFADDTGLEIEALNGEPGVYSARYAGESCDSERNMQRVLANLSEIKNRNAQFRTVISLFWEGETYLFEGVVKGRIVEEKRGKDGFGYDPIFEPENCGKTFAEMDLAEKNTLSHRSRALMKMVEFLQTQKK
jgi:XTP/dITP diphosphohydrolase